MSTDGILSRLAASGCFSGASIAGWTTDPAVLVPMLLGLGLYLAGLFRLWSAAGIGRGASPVQALAFATGWLLLAIAVISPLHEWSRRLFSVHMIEHELVIAAAAPLLALSRPLAILLWAFPARWRGPAARTARTGAYFLGWDILSLPLVATVLHAIAIWVWHVPILFDAALVYEPLHWLQHLSFFVTAMFFWWSLLGRRTAPGIAVACLFFTAMHSGFLGVLIALAGRPMYPLQAQFATAYGLDPLADQQLAGLIMWVPAGFAYVVAGLAVAGLWIARSTHEAGHAQRI
jgi:cytochrome c oxidase assembly factor CtaG